MFHTCWSLSAIFLLVLYEDQPISMLQNPPVFLVFWVFVLIHHLIFFNSKLTFIFMYVFMFLKLKKISSHSPVEMPSLARMTSAFPSLHPNCLSTVSECGRCKDT